MSSKQSAPNSPWLTALVAGSAFCILREALALAGQDSLAGEVALVTGGTRGLGLEIARELARQGCRLALCARDEAELNAVKAELAGRGIAVLTLRCDVADAGDVRSMVELATERYGRVDIVVNNAGVIEVGPAAEMTRDDYAEALDITYWGMLNVVAAALPQMRARRSGRIVNINSVAGKVPVPHLLPYVGAKFAAAGVSEGLSAELKRDGIHVTTVFPGLMRTGSYLQAQFRGRRQYEAAWFSLSASLPGLAITPESAARQIVRAVRRREMETVLSVPAKLLAFSFAVFPRAALALLAWVNRALPPPAGGGGDGAKQSGAQVKRDLGNSPLAAFLSVGLGDARKHNELPAAERSVAGGGNGSAGPATG